MDSIELGKLKDDILKYLTIDTGQIIYTISIKLDKPFNHCYIACEELEKTDLIEWSDTSFKSRDDKMVNITERGIFFQNKNSFKNIAISELKRIKDDNTKRQIKERKESEKLDWDLMISRFQAKTKLAPLIIAALSFIFSAWAIIKPQSEIKELKLELKKITDTISVLHLPKTEDATHKELPLVESDTTDKHP